MRHPLVCVPRRLTRRRSPLTVTTMMLLATMVPMAKGGDGEPDESVTSAAEAVPPDELGRVVRLGETLVNETDTHPLTQPFVGNSLRCTSCHLDAGRHPSAASFIGVAAAYPAWSPREQRVITLEDRILNCFIRSQNGKRPPNGGQASVAIASYITWLSRGTPIAMNAAQPLGPHHLAMLDEPARAPDTKRGKVLYADRCADCHAVDGSGTPEGPPVWGDASFNDGAGLSKVTKMASWLKVAMPLDDTDLSDQEAFDLAAYLTDQARPRFTMPPDDQP
ncbi:c-type cytochrome [Roseiconus nitratireducens]|uniref:C-type cytochrome n=1 Tax=Roseiconus nitratireducens TaxID=2605748 RepID=A0A5M6D9F7_9BACT|nr:c-type cytochrome [Roseiconus nitratireducens]KAA5541835.1 c-type cytochrome [Roseiconus nitratireducens]